MHKTLLKAMQGFGVGQILEYTPQNNSDMVPVEHPRVLQAHINLSESPFSALTVYILLSNNLNISEYHSLGAIRVEGFRVFHICEAVQTNRIVNVASSGCIEVLYTCLEHGEAMHRYPNRCLTAASFKSSASTFDG
ncbi:hypothetical protein BDY19DRAFT_998660 [Irpex rosettiformis]|uniref:Uncharacterized protein n=1 Tax=Irpex rosettiformis TaxID=378272 RepID=A0ACB8TMY1_9APHY|nr:hypothetical protein BDY19DRAFT_998660 [Irpex rosettiformis]